MTPAQTAGDRPNSPSATTVWEHGRFDAKRAPGKLLFGRMYEDSAIERSAFRLGSRVFCIASAGCTAIALAPDHDVVAVDINRIQLDYAERRAAGQPAATGAAERVLGFGRGFAPAVGWSASRLARFLELDDPAEQAAYWRAHLDTWRFRRAFDALLSLTALSAVYAAPFLAFLPPRLGSVLRGRMLRCFARHSNRSNGYARALLLGEAPDEAPRAAPASIRFAHADAAGFLEAAEPGSFDAFALSNILDGADGAYARRLAAAVKRAAAPGAVAVLRSFREPAVALPTNRAADDRAMLWGVVDVVPAALLPDAIGIP